MLETLLIAAGVFIITAALWFQACKNRAFKDRTALLRASREIPGMVPTFPSGLYTRHLWRLFFFRDPWVIYPPAWRRLAFMANLSKDPHDA